MKLNMKVNELGIVIGCFNQKDFIGKIVRCKESFYSTRYKCAAWIVDVDLGGNFEGIADKHLRPIRDSDGEDETLTWAGKPEGVAA